MRFTPIAALMAGSLATAAREGPALRAALGRESLV